LHCCTAHQLQSDNHCGTRCQWPTCLPWQTLGKIALQALLRALRATGHNCNTHCDSSTVAAGAHFKQRQSQVCPTSSESQKKPRQRLSSHTQRQMHPRAGRVLRPNGPVSYHTARPRSGTRVTRAPPCHGTAGQALLLSHPLLPTESSLQQVASSAAGGSSAEASVMHCGGVWSTTGSRCA
jgi:hypothetical protein